MWHRNTMQTSVLFTVLQLCSLPVWTVSSPVCLLQGVLVEATYHLLTDLGGAFPGDCVKYNANISFPDSVLPAATNNDPQCHEASWVVFTSLKEAWEVFEDYNITVGKNGLNRTEIKLDNFQNLQYQIVEEGRRCLFHDESSHHLSSYFHNVRTVLQQQDSAGCGWQALRRDLLRVLRSVLQKQRACFVWRDAH